MKRLTINEVQSNLDLAVSERRRDAAVLEGKLKMEIELMKHDIKEIKSEVCNVKAGMNSIEAKLDTALEKKADKDEVEGIKKGIFWAVTTAIGMLATILVYLVTNHIK